MLWGLLLVCLGVLVAATYLLVQCSAHLQDNKSTESLGHVHMNRFVITEAEKGTSPSWQGEHRHPMG